MIACDSCFDTNGCALGTLFDQPDVRSGRDVTRFFGDPLWDSIQAEASFEADREPLLRPLLEQAVLHRDSFGNGLAMLLSQKLCGQALDSEKFYAQLGDVIAKDVTIIEAVRNDLVTIQAVDPATTSLLHPLLNFKGYLAVQAHRIAHALWSSNRRALAYHIQSRVSEVFGVDIHPAARVGSGVFIDHATGVVIGETAVVGDDVTILHGVTLGGTGKESGDRHPKIGRGVFIGANAQLLGNIVIGDGSRIGASSVVLKSVEAYSTVAGVPAQVVSRERRPAIFSRGAAELVAASANT
jgi:serine O-acetyltransferase